MLWHLHHIIWKVAGGSDRLDNLALLHPNCHRQVHSRDNPFPPRVRYRAFEGLELDEAKVSCPVLRGREAP
jgi:5-methylcytosine-specific restriction endonuclease McrA